MKNIFALILFLLLASVASASRITLSITVTNAPENLTNGMFSVNGSYRKWSNSASSTLMPITNTTSQAATNIYNNVLGNSFGGQYTAQIATNTFKLVGSEGASISVTISGAWGYVRLSTNTSPVTVPVLIPGSNMPPANVTDQTARIIKDINTYGTDTFSAARVPGGGGDVYTVSNNTLTGSNKFTGGNVIVHDATGTNQPVSLFQSAQSNAADRAYALAQAQSANATNVTIQTQTNGVDSVNAGTLNFIAKGGLTRQVTNNGGKADLILDGSALASTNATPTQTIYISMPPRGSDTTGNGTFGTPYATATNAAAIEWGISTQNLACILHINKGTGPRAANMTNATLTVGTITKFWSPAPGTNVNQIAFSNTLWGSMVSNIYDAFNTNQLPNTVLVSNNIGTSVDITLGVSNALPTTAYSTPNTGVSFSVENRYVVDHSRIFNIEAGSWTQNTMATFPAVSKIVGAGRAATVFNLSTNINYLFSLGSNSELRALTGWATNGIVAAPFNVSANDMYIEDVAAYGGQDSFGPIVSGSTGTFNRVYFWSYTYDNVRVSGPATFWKFINCSFVNTNKDLQPFGARNISFDTFAVIKIFNCDFYAANGTNSGSPNSSDTACIYQQNVSGVCTAFINNSTLLAINPQAGNASTINVTNGAQVYLSGCLTNGSPSLPLTNSSTITYFGMDGQRTTTYSNYAAVVGVGFTNTTGRPALYEFNANLNPSLGLAITSRVDFIDVTQTTTQTEYICGLAASANSAGVRFAKEVPPNEALIISTNLANGAFQTITPVSVGVK